MLFMMHALNCCSKCVDVVVIEWSIILIILVAFGACLGIHNGRIYFCKILSYEDL